MEKLIVGEIRLTINVIAGLILGEAIMRLKIVDKLLRKFLPFFERRHIPKETAFAFALSFGSSKAGAGVISAAFADGTISEYSAIWSTLLLALPSYLHRWPSTFVMSLSMAGISGGLYAVSQLISSILRFVTAFIFLRKVNEVQSSQTVSETRAQIHSHSSRKTSLIKRAIKTLPISWLFFAIAYSLVPEINKFFADVFKAGTFLMPLSGWAVAAGSIAHVSAALALAGGALASGELSISQAVFALILGSTLGSATRILRMNAGYYYALFPLKTANKLLFMNFITIIPFMIINLIIALLCMS